MTKRVSRSSAKVSDKGIGRIAGGAPAGIHPVVQRFWKFTKDTARKFAKNLNNPEEKEEELISAVDRDFKKRS